MSKNVNKLLKLAGYFGRKVASEKMRSILERSQSTNPDYWEKLLKTRSGLLSKDQENPEKMGSYFHGMTREDLEKALHDADWEEYDHPEIKAPAKAYKGKIPGTFGLIRIEKLPSDAKIVLRDPKGTGFVEATVSLNKDEVKGVLERVEHSTAIVGPSKNPEEQVLWTVFPGDPINPSSISSKDYPDGSVISKQEAISLGLEWAKLA